jgi:NADP-dependent 3-hydroxy acid dehydrogenase YdfG
VFFPCNPNPTTNSGVCAAQNHHDNVNVMTPATVAASDIIETMRHAVPSHKTHLTPDQTATLRTLTEHLIQAKPDAPAEYQRFLNIKHRTLPLPDLTRHLNGKTILVTGGTGCIGSTLMNQIIRYDPARLVSLSRGVTTGYPPCHGAEYLICDIRDRPRLDTILRWVQPDVIFHVAAQRSPALAETEVRRTVTTNVLGARNILMTAWEADVPQVVMASTGKALRPYSPEIYTASKRAAEWLAAAAADGLLVSAARFTHVIDNSIVHQRMNGNVIRLHDPDIVFYVQSALESAQLLLLAMIGAEPGEFRVHTIRDLDWPVNLIDVALGVAAAGEITPVYFSGYDPGYEEVPFPGLYDPATAGDVSPLMNTFETGSMVESSCPAVDVFRLRMSCDAVNVKLLDTLSETCERTHKVRSALDDLSWSLLDATLIEAPVGQLRRCAKLIDRHEGTMNSVHRRIAEAVRAHAGNLTKEMIWKTTAGGTG